MADAAFDNVHINIVTDLPTDDFNIAIFRKFFRSLKKNTMRVANFNIHMAVRAVRYGCSAHVDTNSVIVLFRPDNAVDDPYGQGGWAFIE